MSQNLAGHKSSSIDDLPSGKHTKNYGKSPFLMGKSTISMAIFNSYVKLLEGSSRLHEFHSETSWRIYSRIKNRCPWMVFRNPKNQFVDGFAHDNPILIPL